MRHRKKQNIVFRATTFPIDFQALRLGKLDGKQGCCGLCGLRDAADVVPRLEGAGPLGAIIGCRHEVAGQEEEVVDLVGGGQEALGVSGRLEPLHLPFSSPCWLVRIFRPVVEPFMLAVLDAGHDLLPGRPV